MIRDLGIALRMLVAMTILTGFAYPLAVTGIAQALLPWQAGGSLLHRDGRAVGSALIGQPFDGAGYFWSRPSATTPFPYNAASSSGSNVGPTHPALVDAVAGRIKSLREADSGNRASIPSDLVTTSASGLDPHISPAAANYQVERVARARSTEPARIRELVARHTEGRQLGFLGEPRVDVLGLNLELDRTFATK